MINNKDYDVIIVGAGMVGLTLALALPEDLQIALIENQIPKKLFAAEKIDRRVSAINRASQQIFTTANAWKIMQDLRVTPFYGMQVWEEKGQGNIEFNCFDIGESSLGYIIENSVMQQALLQQLETKKNIQIVAPAQPQKIIFQENSATLILENAHTVSAPIIIGADGANSWVREQVGIELKKWSYDQQALITTVRTHLPHQQIARQVFLQAGVLAFLPLPDPHLCSIVWSTEYAAAQRLMNMSDNEFNQIITQHFAPHLGAITKIDSLQMFPLYMRHAKHYIKPRIALVGDAAHTIHPLAGQGLNLGLQDAACLADVIAQAQKKNRDIGHFSTLRRYERARKGKNLLMIGMMESFKRTFNSQSTLITQLRNTGLSFADKNKFIKYFFMRQAMG